MSQNSVQFTLGQIIIISCFLGALAFFSFYLGARFGPELFWGIEVTSLNQQTLLPEEALDKEVQALLAEEGDAPLTFHESLKSGNGVQKAENLEAIKEEPHKAADPVADLPSAVIEKKKMEPPAKAEESKRKEPAPVAKKEPSKPAPVPIETPPLKVAPVQPAPQEEEDSNIAALIREEQAPTPPKAGSYTLQIGSFSSMKDAMALQAKLKTAGYDASMQTVELPGKGKWHRVKMGRYADPEEAQAKKAEIERQYGLTPVVVKL